MHIIHTVSSTEVLFSGVTYCVNELCWGLDRLQEKVEILSLGSSKIQNKSKQLEYKFSGSFNHIPFLKKAGISFEMKKYISENKSDILHTHGLWMFPNCYRNPQTNFVISPHGMLAPGALIFSSRKKQIFDYLFQRSAFEDAKLFFATAESEFEDIRNYGIKAPIAIIPNGVNIPNIKKQKIYKKNKTVLSLGRIHPKKGLDVLIKAWSKIEPIFKNWDLKIVGPSEMGHQKQLEALVKKLNLQRVYFYPPVYGVKKDILISKCDLFVLPSKSENFALTVAESLALEVPVIATKDTPWSGLNVQKCGFWIDSGENSLIKSLKTFMRLSDKELVEMGQRGKRWMQNEFCWEIICQKTLEAYTWITKNSKKPSFIYL